MDTEFTLSGTDISLSNTKIVLLNAPPSAGKDYLADKLQLWYDNISTNEFKAPLYKLVQTIYSISPTIFWSVYNNRDLKEKKMFIGDTKSIRDLMIEVSEGLIKPYYGRDYFGVIASNTKPETSLVVYRDCFGDLDEIQPLIDKYGKGDVICIRIKADGKDFTGDSRRYLCTDQIECFDIYNDMKSDWYVNATVGILKRKGWLVD